MPHTPYLHHNRGVKALRYSVRINREIRLVQTEAFNSVVVDEDTKRLYLVTKGTCQTASRLGRIKLVEYTGKWPRCALLWERLREIVAEVRHGR